MPGEKGMMLIVLLTIMTVKVHDATPTRDGNHGQESEEEGEGEEMEDEETDNGENTDRGMTTRVQTAHGGRHDIEREDQDSRCGASTKQNPNMDREREWRGGGHFEQFETKTEKSFRNKDMSRLMTEKSGQPPNKTFSLYFLTSDLKTSHLSSVNFFSMIDITGIVANLLICSSSSPSCMSCVTDLSIDTNQLKMSTDFRMESGPSLIK
jgi:hypothetical protein